jgi:hypothetical protein
MINGSQVSHMHYLPNEDFELDQRRFLMDEDQLRVLTAR